MTPCLTMEQTQAQHNHKMAAGVKVVNAATQQQQTHFAQLATYWNQKEKDNQQKSKDAQQIAKDIQQLAADKALLAREAAVTAKESKVAALPTETKDTCWTPCAGGFERYQSGEKWVSNAKGVTIDGIPLDEALKAKGEAAYLAQEDYVAFKDEYKTKTKTNRSGGGDGTNLGGGGNANGYQNPGFLNHLAKGLPTIKK